MGVGPTSLVLGVIENDEDLRELSEAQIRERLRFFRNWKMTDVSYALSRMDGLADALNFDQPLGRDETKGLLGRRISWEDFFKIAHDTESQRRRAAEERERSLWHPSSSGYAMIVHEDAILQLEEFRLGDTIRPPPEEYEDCLLYTSPSPRDRG